MTHRARSLAAACLISLTIAGCSGERILQGSAEPPADFGPVRKSLVGCPSMQGAYLWPPVAGEYSKGFASNFRPWDDGMPVAVRKGPMQIWVTDKNRKMVFRSRDINLDRKMRTSLAREWSYAERMFGECVSNKLDFKPEPSTTDAANYGGKGVKRGFRLALLEDGSLAVGIQTVATGRKTRLTIWAGDAPVGPMVDAPDAVYWSWSKLKRIGEGDAEPAPMDAAQPN
jgi:hypothetical protein